MSAKDVEVEAFLLDAVRAFAGLTTLGEVPASAGAWTRAAVDHGVLAPVVSALRTASRQDAVPQEFSAYPAAVTARSIRSMTDLREVGEALDGRGIVWAVLKGPVLADVVFETPGVRDSVDLDVLVAPRDLRAALAALETIGGQVLGMDWSSSSWRRGAECPVQLRHGTVLDLHWHTVNRALVRRTYRGATDGVLERRVSHRVHGVTVWAPDDLDFVLHVLHHACMDGCARLRCVLDAQQCLVWLDRSGYAPEQLARRAVDLGLDVPVSVPIRAAARLMDPHLVTWLGGLGRGTAWTRLSDSLAERSGHLTVATPIGRKMNRHVAPTAAKSALAVLEREVSKANAKRRGEEVNAPPVGFTSPDDPDFQGWLDRSDRSL